MGLPIRLVFALWGAFTRLCYRPKLIFSDEESRRLLQQPCVIIANHTAHRDGTFFPQILRRPRIYTYVTRKWYDKPKLHFFFRRLPYIPVDLTQMDTEWLARGEEVLAKGGRILLFPEGKLERGAGILPFHEGFLLLAKRANVPVIPMATAEGYRPFRRKVIFVGSAVYPTREKGRPSLLLRAQAEDCRQAVAKLLGVTLPATEAEAAPV